eukprot:9328926-Heterocapsa_arctica.AAC.1
MVTSSYQSQISAIKLSNPKFHQLYTARPNVKRILRKTNAIQDSAIIPSILLRLVFRVVRRPLVLKISAMFLPREFVFPQPIESVPSITW